MLVVGPGARTTARLLRSPGLDAHGVRSADQAVARLGLSEAAVDVVLVVPNGTEATGAPELVNDVRRMRTGRPDAFVFLLVESDADPRIVPLLDGGVDDVVVEPVRPEVLAARVRARLRRLPTSASRPAADPLGDLVVDRAARRCLVRECEVPLRAKEFDLLDALVSNVGRVVTRTALMNIVWDEHWFKSTKTLDVTMVGLRRRLREAAEPLGAVLPEISTMRAVGYRLDPVPSAAGDRPAGPARGHVRLP